MYKQDDISCVETADSLLSTRRNKKSAYLEPEERKEKIEGLLDELENCEAPGIPELKKVELYSKWLKVVPEEYWEDTCPIPKQEVLERVKKERSVKQNKRKQGEIESMKVKMNKLSL